ncbi:MAG TPA: fatty acid cis/trans isomerase [Cellvibrio sp.]|nr:fatty acid cis/trans isomerase [Cellvibrio sp.]
MSLSSRATAIFALLLLIGCTTIAGSQWDKLYGQARPLEYRPVAAAAINYHRDIKPLIENRCTVCHGCYDAPCQLKLDSYQGLLRGANASPVYGSPRLLEGKLTRMFEDAQSTADWRAKEFYPVLNERNNNPQANIKASVMAQMLELKREHPLPGDAILPFSFDFNLNPRQYCPRIENFADFRQQQPLWGMPYGLPGLDSAEHQRLIDWLAAGAPVGAEPQALPEVSQQIDTWEKFLNGDSIKQQLVSRYIYEHLFLAQIFFAEAPEQYYRLVRSRTAPGAPLDRISTSRPFDDPQVARVYYRLWRDPTSVVAKTHMPYAFNKARMEQWQALFFDTPYTVTQLPSYARETASNPFVTFAELPINSRYRFMLNEARFTIMNFIKGPVCRGQVALNVIQDHFWVFFYSPETQGSEDNAKFLAENSKHLELPAEVGNSFLPLRNWERYSELQKQYLSAKAAFVAEKHAQEKGMGLGIIWDGDQGRNNNAALTVFRHNDSASVYSGLIGEPPKTAWVIGYPLLERIHYLLVAGFDVYGNVTHQLLSRLYMDFLRVEGEMNFVSLLPKKTQQQEMAFWYRDAESHMQTYLDLYLNQIKANEDLRYTSANPKVELFSALKLRLGKAGLSPHHIRSSGLSASELKLYQALQNAPGTAIRFLPQTTLIRVPEMGLFTLVHNNGYSNISSLFGEENRRLPEEDYLVIARGIIGSYPNSFMQVSKADLPDFVRRVHQLASEEDYKALRDSYGIRRSNPGFWDFSDKLLAEYHNSEPAEAALLDYNRLENR